jgi:hypothetical protein
MPVAHDEAPAVLVAVFLMLGDVDLDLGLERDSEHLTRTLTTDLVDPERDLLGRGVFSDYSQHRRSFLPRRRSNAGSRLVVQRGRYAAPRLRWRIHRFWL